MSSHDGAVGAKTLQRDAERLHDRASALCHGASADEQLESKLKPEDFPAKARREEARISAISNEYRLKVEVPMLESGVTFAVFSSVITPAAQVIQERRREVAAIRRRKDQIKHEIDNLRARLSARKNRDRGETAIGLEESLNETRGAIRQLRKILGEPDPKKIELSQYSDINEYRAAKMREREIIAEWMPSWLGNQYTTATYIPLMLLMFGIEAALNVYVFMFAVGGTWELAVLYSVIIAVCFAIMSHLLGARYKWAQGEVYRRLMAQGEDAAPETPAASRSLSIEDVRFGPVLGRMLFPPDWRILVAILLFLAGLLTILLSRYGLIDPNVGIPNFGDLFDSITGGGSVQPQAGDTDSFGASRFRELGVLATEGSEGWIEFAILVGVNLIVVAVATLLSKGYHHSVPAYADAARVAEIKTRKLQARLKRHEIACEQLEGKVDAINRVDAEDMTALDAAESNLDAIDAMLELYQPEAEIQLVLEKVNDAAKSFDAILRSAIAEHLFDDQRENVRGRNIQEPHGSANFSFFENPLSESPVTLDFLQKLVVEPTQTTTMQNKLRAVKPI